MNEVMSFQAEMSPFGWEPSHVSRIAGLGGGQPAPEGAYAFKTTPLMAPAGNVDITVSFEGLQATRGTLLIEVSGGQDVERRQLQLRTVPLSKLVQTGGSEHITLSTDRREAYTVAGYVYDETDAVAQGVSVRIAVTDADDAGQKTAAIGSMTRAARLAGLEPPSFAHPASQTWSQAQLGEPAFRAACQLAGLEPVAASWPVAYVHQAVKYLLGDMVGLRGFGGGVSAEIAARAFAREGADVLGHPSLDQAHWPPAEGLDFTWLIFEVPWIEAGHLAWMANLLIDRLRPGGVLVLVFSFEHGRMPFEPCDLMARADVELMALRLLAHGHSVAQLKFRPGGRLLPVGTRTSFGMMVRRAME